MKIYLESVSLENEKKILSLSSRRRRSIDDNNKPKDYIEFVGEEGITDYAEYDHDQVDGNGEISVRRRRSVNTNYLYPEEEQYVMNATSTGMEIFNLTLYQWYTLRLAALTSKGPGPTYDLNVSCAQAGKLSFWFLSIFLIMFFNCSEVITVIAFKSDFFCRN